MIKKTLRVKLIAGGLAAVLIPLVVVGLLTVQRTSSALTAVSRNQTVTVAKNLADVVDLALREELKFALTMAANTDVVNVATQVKALGVDGAAAFQVKVYDVLRTFVKQMGETCETIVVTDAEGKIYADGHHSAYQGINIAGQAYYQNTVKAGQPYLGEPTASPKTGALVIPACVPIISVLNEPAGILVVYIKEQFLSARITTVKIGGSGYPFMVGKSGLMLAHPKKDLVMKMNIASVSGMEEIAKRILSGETGTGNYTFEGARKIAGFAPVPITGWSLVACQDADEAMATASSQRNIILLIALLCLIVVLPGIIYFARGITRPLNQAIDELTQTSDHVMDAARQVSATSQLLADGASQQSASIEETSSALEQMAAMTKRNADNAGEADSLMKKVNQVVSNANETMEQLTASMNSISSTGDETQKIIKTIDEIAFQTNLLALNAAVEAARAGEAGAGFAVVADEVRNLAMRAAEAARNTAQMIEQSVARIRKGSDLVKTADKAFTAISESSTKVSVLVGEINVASREQAQGVQQINRAVLDMDKVVQQNAATAEETAATAQEMCAEAELMKGIVENLVTIVVGGEQGGPGRPEGPHAGHPDQGSFYRGNRRLCHGGAYDEESGHPVPAEGR